LPLWLSRRPELAPLPSPTLFRSEALVGVLHSSSFAMACSASSAPVLLRSTTAAQRPDRTFTEPVDGPPQGVRISLRKAFTGLSGDRKSTRLNSSHVKTSYAVCCL